MSRDVDAFVAAYLAFVQLRHGPRAAMERAKEIDAAAREFPELARGYRPLLDTIPEGRTA